jgi:hypothetical protein
MSDTFLEKTPELFYDTIGRLFPGCIILSLFAVMHWQAGHPLCTVDNYEKIGLAGGVIFAIGAYFVGLCFDLLASFFEPITGLLWKYRTKKANIKWIPPSSDHQWLCIRKEQAKQTHRLLKIKAEMLLLRSTYLGAVILAAYFGIVHGLNYICLPGIIALASLLSNYKLGLAFTKTQLDINHLGLWNEVIENAAPDQPAEIVPAITTTPPRERD